MVATAGNATKLLGEYQPDVVILDLGLPDQDGQEWLKSARSHSEIPIIVVSARNDTEEVVKLLIMALMTISKNLLICLSLLLELKDS
ncbi:response regulator [Francisella tularensis]|uniref:response regulator n=1 Tax=Francisella tularensis TaxID=263 RepID=UPI002D7F5D34|nr:response regulator [Francisella tularensis]